MDKDKINAFIEEYKALCEKYHLMLDPRRDDNMEMSIAVVEPEDFRNLNDNLNEIIETTQSYNQIKL